MFVLAADATVAALLFGAYLLVAGAAGRLELCDVCLFWRVVQLWSVAYIYVCVRITRLNGHLCIYNYICLCVMKLCYVLNDHLCIYTCVGAQ